MWLLFFICAPGFICRICFVNISSSYLFWYLQRAVLRDCDISGVSSLIYNIKA